MMKPPEEGQVWEWRGFGKISRHITTQVEALPIRNRIRDIAATDLYLISPTSEQNVKLRLTNKGWVLKFKLLLAKREDGIELYHETARWTYPFPIRTAVLQEAARLLDLLLPDAALEAESFTEPESIAALQSATPAVIAVETRKVRSQYQFDGGWLEIADVDFGGQQTQSLSLHSPSMAVVERMVEQLHPDNSLTVINYVEACRLYQK
jgi:hypothetical protein